MTIFNKTVVQLSVDGNILYGQT